MNCGNCFHPEGNHKNIDGTDKAICNATIGCRCEKFVTHELMEFAERIEKEKYERRTVRERCEYILVNIPQTRNAGEKTFAKIYQEIWHGVKIRKNAKDSTAIDSNIHKDMPHADTINRAKRSCKQWNDELKTYSKQVLFHQTAIYQALVEMSAEH